MYLLFLTLCSLGMETQIAIHAEPAADQVVYAADAPRLSVNAALSLPPASFVVEPSIFGDVKTAARARLQQIQPEAGSQAIKRAPTPASYNIRADDIIESKWRFADELIHVDHHSAHSGFFD